MLRERSSVGRRRRSSQPCPPPRCPPVLLCFLGSLIYSVTVFMLWSRRSGYESDGSVVMSELLGPTLASFPTGTSGHSSSVCGAQQARTHADSAYAELGLLNGALLSGRTLPASELSPCEGFEQSSSNCGGVWFDGLRDVLFASKHLQLLDGNDWKATSQPKLITMSAVVPGDLITDLARHGVPPHHPLQDNSWHNNSLREIYFDQEWTYEKKFVLSQSLISACKADAAQVFLIMDGVKMGAHVYFDDVFVGDMADQFLRYRFDVGKLLSTKGCEQCQLHTVRVVFPNTKDTSIPNEGRFMGCTGGWDWAPYTHAVDASSGATTFSRGIWKSVYLAAIPENAVAIESVVPHVRYLGDFPVVPISANTAEFQVDVDVTVVAAKSTRGFLKVTGSWGGSAPAVDVNVGQNGEMKKTVSIAVPQHTVELWWPAGLGRQTLYHVNVSFVANEGDTDPLVSTQRRVAFRVGALITHRMSSEEEAVALRNVSSSGSFTMRVIVNGAGMWIRGANFVPTSQFEGEVTEDDLRDVVRSARLGGMNMLRVWGGGVFQYSAFYDECDRQGVLVFQDMMYATNHMAKQSLMQERELKYQLQRMAQHPSVFMYSACNECAASGIMISFVMETVARELPTAVIWPASPARGWSAGVSGLYSTPDGTTLAVSGSGRSVDSHGPYWPGSGHDTVEPSISNQNFGNIKVRLPVHLPVNGAQNIGLGVQGGFSSEFGCVGMSSFESMSEFLNESQWGLHSPAMYQRNYPCDSIIAAYFGDEALPDDSVGEEVFKSQLFRCNMGFSIHMGDHIKQRRATNEYGMLAWMLNEHWPTGGWGSLEAASTGGRWKLLHHLYADGLLTDQIFVCGVGNPSFATPSHTHAYQTGGGAPANAQGVCYIRNDNPLGAIVVSAKLYLLRFKQNDRKLVWEKEIELAAGPAIVSRFCIDGAEYTDGKSCIEMNSFLGSQGCTPEGSDCSLHTVIVGKEQNEVKVSSSIHSLLASPAQMHDLSKSPSLHWNVEKSATRGFIVMVEADDVALYVTLTTRVRGHFSTNGFQIWPGEKVIARFCARDSETQKMSAEDFKAGLRVESLGEYIPK